MGLRWCAMGCDGVRWGAHGVRMGCDGGRWGAHGARWWAMGCDGVRWGAMGDLSINNDSIYDVNNYVEFLSFDVFEE